MIQDPNTVEAKVQASREAVEASVKHIRETKPSVRAKSSPIATLLEPYADEIRAAFRDGWTAGAIARDLCARGVKFREDSIRLRIGVMFSQERAAAPKRPRNAQPSRKPVRSAGSSAVRPVVPATTHAGFEEDPK
jgi:hypothetical protein